MEPIDRLLPELLGSKESSLLKLLTIGKRLGHTALRPPFDELFSEAELPPFPINLEETSPYIARFKEWSLFKGEEQREKQLVQETHRLLQETPKYKASVGNHPTLEPEQRNFIELAMETSFVALIGGPGTGKTYTASCFIFDLLKQHPSLRLAITAPTGKAALRLKESLCAHTTPKHITVQTLHALTKPSATRFLPYDLLVVDEASMIDADMMPKLFSCVAPQSRLLLLGDQNQLPPVELGTPFQDLLPLLEQLGHLQRLEKCVRIENPEILALAQRVCRGEMIPLRPLSEWQPEGHTILTPLRRGPFGSVAINAKCLAKTPKTMPILITQNDYEKELYNGDVGLLELGEGEEERPLRARTQAICRFGERHFLPYELPPFEPAFALSIHKSQGSEYESADLLLPPGSEKFSREMLYTGMTRVKKKIRIFGDPAAVSKMLQRSGKRQSSFLERYADTYCKAIKS